MARRRHGEIATLPTSVAHFFRADARSRPAPAIGYQLLFDDGRHLYRYPSARRSGFRPMASSCNRSAFRLYPFEIPIVPRRSLYAAAGHALLSLTHAQRLAAGGGLTPCAPVSSRKEI